MKLTIKQRLAAGFSAVVGLCALVGGVGAWGLLQVWDDLTAITDRQVKAYGSVSEIGESLRHTQASERALLIPDLPEADRQLERQRLMQAWEHLEKSLETYVSTPQSEEAKQIAREVEESTRAWKTANLRTTELAMDRKFSEALQYMLAQGRPLVIAASESVDKATVYQRDAVQERRAQAAVSMSQAKTAMAVAAVLAAICAMTIGFLLWRGIDGPLKSASELLSQVSTGDLTGRLNMSDHDEIGKLASYLDKTLGDLNSALETVRHASVRAQRSAAGLDQAAGEVGRSVQEVARASEDVAKGATQTSASLTESTSRLSELESAVADVAAGAAKTQSVLQTTAKEIREIVERIREADGTSRSVAGLAEQVGAAAHQGAEHAQRGVEGMERVRNASDMVTEAIRELGVVSERIGTIVHTIDDIAAQTNMLALNAAIEAARAGEHGRGFAVVAEEVRKLAERSSSSTKEIANLIGGIQEMTQRAVSAVEASHTEIAKGSEVVAEAGTALIEIQSGVDQVRQGINAVSGAATRIHDAAEKVLASVDGLTQIAEKTSESSSEMAETASVVRRLADDVAASAERGAAAAEEMSAGTQEAAAGVEEVIATIAEVSRGANELLEVVDRFRLNSVELTLTRNDQPRAA